MTEIWKQVTGYAEYIEASSHGRIRSISREYIGVTPLGVPCTRRLIGRVLTQTISRNGYARIGVSINGKLKTISVHRLVASTFIPNYTRHPQVNHIDGDKLNNSINNLEWCDAVYNQRHAIDAGLVRIRRGTERAFAKLTNQDVRDIRNEIQRGTPYTAISAKFGICPSKITLIKQGKAWSHVV